MILMSNNQWKCDENNDIWRAMGEDCSAEARVKGLVRAYRRILPEAEEHYYCVYASRKDGHRYARTHEQIMERYGDCMVMQEEMPPMNWPQMGRYMYTARLKTFEEAQDFIQFVQGAE